jgi:thiamine-phosphate pyrophosphorylase
MVRAAGAPVYALGGVTLRTARRLKGSGAAGLAAVEAFAD